MNIQQDPVCIHDIFAHFKDNLTVEDPNQWKRAFQIEKKLKNRKTQKLENFEKLKDAENNVSLTLKTHKQQTSYHGARPNWRSNELRPIIKFFWQEYWLCEYFVFISGWRGTSLFGHVFMRLQNIHLMAILAVNPFYIWYITLSVYLWLVGAMEKPSDCFSLVANALHLLSA